MAKAPKSGVMKILRKLRWIILLGVMLLVMKFGTDYMIQKEFKSFTSDYMHVNSTVGSTTYNWFTGRMVVHDWKINNPVGFKSEHLMTISRLECVVPAYEFIGDHIEMDLIQVDGFELTRETAKGRPNNLKTVMETLDVLIEEEEAALEIPDATTYFIREMRFENGKLMVGGRLLSGNAIAVALPKVVLKDLGFEEEGTTIKSILRSLLKSLDLKARNAN